MEDYGLFFKELCADDCFLPANIARKMSIQALMTVKKNKSYFTKTEYLTVHTNDSQIAANAKFNGNGNRVFVEDNEPIIQLLIP